MCLTVADGHGAPGLDYDVPGPIRCSFDQRQLRRHTKSDIIGGAGERSDTLAT